MDNGYLIFAQSQILGEVLFEETQCLDALGENDDAVVGVSRIPVEKAAWLQDFNQALVLGEVAGSDVFQSFRNAAQGNAVLVGIRAGFLLDLSQALANCLRQAAGEEKRDFSSTVLKRSCPVRRVWSKDRNRASARRS